MSEGKEIDIRAVPGVRVFVAREEALIALNPASADVRVETSQRLGILLPPVVTQSCERAKTWTISGSHKTASNGKAAVRLDRFLACAPSAIDGSSGRNYLGSRPSFTATPEAAEPVFLTCTIDATPSPQGFFPPQLAVTVTVMSWRHDGTAAPDTAFSWIAIAREANEIGG